MTIAVMTPRYTAIFVMLIASLIEKIIAKENYSLVMYNFEEDEEKLVEKLQFLKRRAIDGIIIFPEDKGTASIPLLEEYLGKNIPIVLINELIPGFKTDAVLVDDVNAAARAVEKLILRNHTDIAIVSGRKNSYVSQQRLKGYYDVMRAYDLDVEDHWVKWGDFKSAGGYQVTKELCASSRPPTAIFIINYFMTMGAVMALHELRLRIPDDMSIFGFDHFEPSDVIEPPLTVVEHPIQDIAEHTAHVILQRIRGDYSDFPTTVTLNTTMLIRDSVSTR